MKSLRLAKASRYNARFMLRVVRYAMASIFACALVAPASAQQRVIIETVEVAVARADVIVLGTIIEIHDPQRVGDLFREVMIQVEESAKGTPPSQVIIPLLGWTSDEQSLRVGQQIMAFLVRTERLDEFEPLPPDIYQAIQKYGLALLPGDNHILRLNSPALSAVTMDLRALREPVDVINAIADAAAVSTPRSRGLLKTVLITPPYENNPVMGLYGDASVSLEMVVDARLERLGREWASKGYLWQALEALRLFPAENNLPIFERFVKSDPLFIDWPILRSGEGVYPVRAAAWNILNEAGIRSVQRPIIAEPHDRYVAVGAWRVIVVLSALMILTLAVCRRIFKQYSPLRLGCSFGLLMAVLVTAMWTRSYLVVDELLLETSTAQNWIVSTSGDAVFMQVGGLAEQCHPAFNFRDNPVPGGAIDGGWLPEKEAHNPRGLIRATYDPEHVWRWSPSAALTTSPFVARIPYGWLLLASLIPLALHLLLELKRYVVMRERLLNRQCVHCGYDLRASSGRCPECGVEVVLR